MVRGGSSTGKTRALFEAVQAVLPGWRLDYPLDAAALARRLDAGVAEGTVLWLGELRQYADADGSDQALGRLADLLNGPGRIVVTTIWPETAAGYLEAAEREGSRNATATCGRLLQRVPDLVVAGPEPTDPALGGVVSVPAVFSDEDLAAATATGDPVLAEAVEAAAAAGKPGQVAQYLAGALVLTA